ncbi:unnamed protein product [Closterium sp. Naga37s-1]|nr:unnamed protein product [Closterium sp. Naga37s-1]
MSAAAVAAFGGKLLEEPRRRGIEIGGWRIECRHEPILTAEETEAWQAALSSQWLPEMVFGKSCLRAEHLGTGVGVQLGALEALRGWKEARLPPVKVPAAAAWGKRSCPSTDIILDYDYTFTTPYRGSIITSSSASLSPESSMAGSSNSNSSSSSSSTTTTTSTHAPDDVSAPLASCVADISISNADRGLAVGAGGEGEEGRGARVRAEGMREGEVEGAGEKAQVVREVQAVWPQSDAFGAGGVGVGGEGGGGEGGSVEKRSQRGAEGEENKGSGGEKEGRGAGGGGEWEAEWVACGEGEGIDWALLQRRDPIFFSDEVLMVGMW